MVLDDTGKIVNPQFRNYRIPAYADVPRTEIFFADTHDSIGPLGAKGMGECPINPVAPALANALADATGVRFRDLPFRPDLIFKPIYEKHGSGWQASSIGAASDAAPASPLIVVEEDPQGRVQSDRRIGRYVRTRG